MFSEIGSVLTFGIQPAKKITNDFPSIVKGGNTKTPKLALDT